MPVKSLRSVAAICLILFAILGVTESLADDCTYLTPTGALCPGDTGPAGPLHMTECPNLPSGANMQNSCTCYKDVLSGPWGGCGYNDGTANCHQASTQSQFMCAMYATCEWDATNLSCRWDSNGRIISYYTSSTWFYTTACDGPAE